MIKSTVQLSCSSQTTQLCELKLYKKKIYVFPLLLILPEYMNKVKPASDDISDVL